jgi:hypothetical protein
MKKAKPINAIKINVETRRIEDVTIGSSKDIYEQIGCEMFEVPVTFKNADALYCDEEALLKSSSIKGGFMMPGWVRPILGNAIIVGTNKDGDSCDCKSNISDLEVKFYDAETCQQYAKSIGF